MGSARAHDCRRIAELCEHHPPRLARLIRAEIRHHPELRVPHLERRMHHVTGDERIRAGLSYPHGIVVDRMARGWHEMHQVAQAMVALHQLEALGLDDWQNGVADPRACFWLVFMSLGPECEFAVGKQVLRIWKRRHPAPILKRVFQPT